MRFAHGVSDAFIDDYAARMTEMGSVVYGYVEDDEVRAAAELRKLGDAWGQEAEAAFSVEPTHQDLGIGSEPDGPDHPFGPQSRRAAALYELLA